jgi:4-aminobutyrate aminotransferase
MGNADFLIRREHAIPVGLISQTPIFVARAENDQLWDVDGRRYIDFASGIAVLNVGHGNPAVMERVQRQLQQFSHTHFQVCQYESYVAVAERLNELAPIRRPGKTVLFSTGAEAIENAIKIARIATGRSAVVAFAGAFHGRTLMALALTGRVSPYKHGLGPLPSEVYHLPFPMKIHGITDEQSLAALELLFRTVLEPKRVAAIIIEPVQGEGGLYPAPHSLLRSLRSICDEHGILLIGDEIQTGFARTGRMFAFEHAGVEADLVTMAKSLGGGLPLSAVTGSAAVMDRVPAGGFGSTFAGNPLACAAALGVLDVIESQGLVSRAVEIGQRLFDSLKHLQQGNAASVIGEIRVIGAMVAIEFITDQARKTPNPILAQTAVTHALSRGLILSTCGVYGNVVRILAPLTVRYEVLEEGASILGESILQALSDAEIRAG